MILVLIKSLVSMLLPLKWVFKANHDTWSLPTWSSSFLFFISANKYNDSSIYHCNFIIISQQVNFIIYLYMSYITNSWTSLLQKRTFPSSYISMSSFMTFSNRGCLIHNSNHHELVDSNTNLHKQNNIRKKTCINNTKIYRIGSPQKKNLIQNFTIEYFLFKKSYEIQNR